MNMLASNEPHKVITWKDSENTGAIGWIVIHNIFNDIAGGGLFMDESATLEEVKDLAYTMMLKNSLQQPIFGGGKGGIKFNPHDPRAKSVLKRFIKDNIDVINTEWCTGGDLNTTTKDIAECVDEISGIKTPFASLANMVEKNLKKQINIHQFNTYLRMRENKLFTIEDAITGYSIFKTIEKCASDRPKIIVQGFGKVGKAFCHYAQEKYSIIGICERDWFTIDPDGLDINSLLSSKMGNITTREVAESHEDFLIKFLMQTRADIFCPCAIRYTITNKILDVLINHTFLNDAYIISGANNVFSDLRLIQTAFENNVTVIPEWLSNSGSAILFMEALKYSSDRKYWLNFIKEQVANRISDFLDQASVIATQQSLNIYEACCQLVNEYREI